MSESSTSSDRGVPAGMSRDRANTGKTLLRDCARLMIRRLFDVWPTMMDKVDDALFELAEKAPDGRAQAEFFDAMRHVRLKRTEMEETFRTALKQGVSKPKRAGAAKDADAAEPSLSLVQTDELEESLAVTNMVEKVDKTCHAALFALDRRVAELTGKRTERTITNPFGPKVICEAFRSACAVLDLDIEVRLHVLKLFDRHVVSEAEGIYASLNELLIANGVLPEIPNEVRKSAAAPHVGAASGASAEAVAAGAQMAAAAGGPAPAQAVPGVAPAVAQGAVAGFTGAPGSGFASPGAVMPGAAMPGAAMPGGPAHAGAVAGAAAAAGAVPSFASLVPGQAPAPEQVLDALYQIMTVKGAAELSQGAAPSGPLFASLGDLQLKEYVALEVAPPEGEVVGHPLRALTEASELGAAEPIDQILIDVVAMMFEYILDDDSMPSEMKALISRLQIPMLKVAILDKSCFARMHHPARSLLNTLAEAAVGWQSEYGRDSAFHARIEGFVRQVLTDFDDDVSVFAEVLKALREFLDEEKHKAEYEAEQTTRLLKRRERLALARAATRETLTPHLTRPGMPPFVHEFLSGHWRELLIAHYVNDDTGERFAEAVNVTDELVWSLLPQPHLDWRKKLLKSLSGLVESLRAQLQSFPLPGGEEQRFFKALSSFHLELVRSGTAPQASTPEPEAAADEPVATDDRASDLAADVAAEEAPAVPGEEQPVERDDGSALLATIRDGITRANAAVLARAEANPECQGMGTTVVVAHCANEWLSMGHVGDSRLYRKRENRLEQLTRDHSLREDLVAKGFYSRDEVAEKVPGNYVTRAVGADAEIDVDVDRVFTLEGDKFLLCSDGLSDLVSDEAINAILDQEATVQVYAQALVDAANEAGGLDNVTAAVMQIVTAPDGQRVVAVAGLSDVGRKRSNNEDCVFVDADASLAVVADGMGGANAGEVASAMTVAVLREAFGLGARDHAGVPEAPIAAAGGRDESPLASANLPAIDALLNDASEASSAQPDPWSGAPDLQSLTEAFGEVEEIVLDSNVTHMEQARAETTVEDDSLDSVRKLAIGTWVLFTKADGAEVRGRLTWRSDVSDKLLFTDRGGIKVSDPTVHGLAIELRRGTARIIEDVPLFDRAISSLTQRLRGSGAEPAGR